MRKLYNEFFYIPKYGKVREKVMLARVVTTITIMVMCLAAVSFAAYAYFSYNVTSGFNTIKSANFEANVSITITDSKKEPVTVTKDGKVQTATLDAGEYTVLLTKDKGTSTANTGFCIITIGDTDYYTQQIGVDVERGLTDGSASVEFTLEVSSATKIEILSHWGTSSCYGYEETSNNPVYIKSGDEVDLTASTVGNDETSSTEEQGTTESTANTEPSTTPTTDATIPTTSTEPSTSPTTDSTTPSTETTETTEPTTSISTEPTVTEPTVTEPAVTESTDTTENTETQPTTETTEPTGAPTTEANE